MKSKSRLFLFLLLVTLTSCDQINKLARLDQPEVKSVSPATNSQNVDVNSSIEIEFSKSMDINSTNNAISLSGEDTPINGVYTWNANNTTVIFQPNKPLLDYNIYTITIANSAEDTDGNDLYTDFTSVFYTVSDLEGPKISTFVPGDNITGVSSESTISIEFNEQIDTNTVYSNISFSPPIDGVFSYENNNTLIKYTPYQNLTFGTTYFTTVATGIKDINGNPLKEEKIYNFTVGDTYIPISINSIKQVGQVDSWLQHSSNADVNTKDSIEIVFSTDISWESVINQISFSPEALYYFTVSNKSVIITFTSDLSPETQYQLTLSDNISDTQKNTLEEPITYTFITDNSSSLRPLINQITDPQITGGNWVSVNTGNEQVLSLSTIPPITPTYEDVTIHFTKPMQPHSVEFEFELITADTLIPYIYNPRWNLSFDELTINLGNVTGSCLYKLTVFGGENGAKDEDGYTMNEDFVQFIRF